MPKNRVPCLRKQLELELWRDARLRPTGEVPWLTLDVALAEAQKLHQEDPDNRLILSELIEWIQAFPFSTEQLSEPGRQLAMV